MCSFKSFNKKPRVLCVIGTRPEAIKMAPVILSLKSCANLEVVVLNTSQHKELLEQTLKIFNIQPDLDLNIMKKNQKLGELTSSLLKKLTKAFKQLKSDLVLAQGDTTTVMTTALTCFYEKIPFGHVEAGLRSYDIYNPYPEEFNRIIADRLASLNFAPTERAKLNLIKEGIPENTIFVTGNTVIDALLYIAKQTYKPDGLFNLLQQNKKVILVTLHRRESFHEPLFKIFSALKILAKKHSKEFLIIYPVHPNPNVKNPAYKMLGNIPNILLLPPLDYLTFINLLKKSWIVLTDSGGIQEEAPALGKPVLVVRDTTERPEVIEHGLGKLIGRTPEKIISEVENLLYNPEKYQKMAKGYSPYGDGKASKRILKVIKKFFSL